MSVDYKPKLSTLGKKIRTFGTLQPFGSSFSKNRGYTYSKPMAGLYEKDDVYPLKEVAHNNNAFFKASAYFFFEVRSHKTVCWNFDTNLIFKIFVSFWFFKYFIGKIKTNWHKVCPTSLPRLCNIPQVLSPGHCCRAPYRGATTHVRVRVCYFKTLVFKEWVEIKVLDRCVEYRLYT